MDYVHLMKKCFDFEGIRKFLTNPDFSIRFDGMHGISGPYAHRILGDELQVPIENLLRCNVLEDFGGCHPDPNLTYAAELVETMGIFNHKPDAPSFAAACDGDADRNMILGKNFFVTPSDSVAIIAAKHLCIPQFSEGITGAARSMPTSAALDRVLEKAKKDAFETPTGWKFFGNLLDESLI
jgi:phosphoglucomutase